MKVPRKWETRRLPEVVLTLPEVVGERLKVEVRVGGQATRTYQHLPAPTAGLPYTGEELSKTSSDIRPPALSRYTATNHDFIGFLRDFIRYTSATKSATRTATHPDKAEVESRKQKRGQPIAWFVCLLTSSREGL